MADEFVSTAQFGEFVKRIDERFDHVQKDMANGFAYVNQLADQRYESLNQRLADADKAREQNLVHINQRFDDMNARFGDMNAALWRSWIEASINAVDDAVNAAVSQLDDADFSAPMLIAILGLVGGHCV